MGSSAPQHHPETLSSPQLTWQERAETREQYVYAFRSLFPLFVALLFMCAGYFLSSITFSYQFAQA